MWRFKEMWRSRRMKSDLERARQERVLSQRRFEEAQVQVIVPLSALREENHITDLIRESFQKRSKEDK
jgi:hypothetical protein